MTGRVVIVAGVVVAAGGCQSAKDFINRPDQLAKGWCEQTLRVAETAIDSALVMVATYYPRDYRNCRSVLADSTVVSITPESR